MKAILRWIINAEADEKEAFELGYKLGKEDGIREGMAKNFERTRELTDKEYEEVIKFLVDRKLELCCYDVMKGGFRIRKRNYENERL